MFRGCDRRGMVEVRRGLRTSGLVSSVRVRWPRLVSLACLAAWLGVPFIGLSACQPRTDRRVVITVGSSWGGQAAVALHRELLRIADGLGAATIQVRSFSLAGLAEYLDRSQVSRGEARLDLVIVPNDWLGQLAERGVIGELPQPRVEVLQDTLVRQALLAVSDRDKVLAYPASADVLALVYDPERFPSPPRTLDDIMHARLPSGTLPFALDLSSPYQLAPFVTSYQGSLLDRSGNLIWQDDVLVKVLRRFAPLWQEDSAWRTFAGGDLDSLQLQLFAEGRLASFPTGPWMLQALEECGRPFAVTPVPAFADAPHPARALVGYQCVAVLKDSPWVDLALEIGARLVQPESNERLNRASRRLPVLLSAYKTEAAMASPGTVGFLRAVEQGQFFPAAAQWGEGFQQAGRRLLTLSHRTLPPSPAQVEDLISRGRP
ncbi:MAG: extracellular solute-binding protein [Acidobacteriota bacterium]